MSDSLAFQVELFADLMVRLDDPFGERALVLAAAGLDEERYRSLLGSWRTRFDRDEGRLGERFADAYGERCAALATRREREASGALAPVDARFLNAEALGFREEAARVARDTTEAAPPLRAPERDEAPSPPSVAAPASLAAPPSYVRPPERFAGTADISAFVPRIQMPFAPADPAAPPEAAAPAVPPRPRVDSGTRAIIAFAQPATPTPFVDREAAAPEPPPLVARPPARFAGTADIAAFVPRPATPFQEGAAEPRRAVQPVEPRRRLIRFDPQTGQPLPSPTWVDLPPEGEGRKR
jgi:hypothetical protein